MAWHHARKIKIIHLLLTAALHVAYYAKYCTKCKIISKGRANMKSLILSVVLASTSVAAVAADSVSVNGKWKIHNSIAGNESDMSCTFTQKDADLTGSCKSDNGEGKATGRVDGKNVTLTFESEYEGSPVTSKYSGTLDSAANKIAGTVTVEQYSVDGEFTAVPEK
jgi:hypothetical protein